MRMTLYATLLGVLVAGVLPAQGEAPVKEPQKAPEAKPEDRAKPKVLIVGSEVPADLTLTDVAGKAVRFGDLRGKVVFIHFWSIVCPYERWAEPKILKMEKDYKDQVVILAINANTGEIGPRPAPEEFTGEKKPYAKIRKHIEATGMGHTVLIDHGNKVADLFGARTTPHCFVLDKKGIVRYAGGLDNDAQDRNPGGAIPYVRNAIDAVLGDKEVEVKTSAPYG